MRLFVAVTLGEQVTSRAEAAVARLRALAPRARWARLEGLHLTLAFLGETPPERVPALEAALREVAARHAPFRLSAAGGGSFGSHARPRVLWADVCGDTAALGALQADVARALTPLGFTPESRPYTAHLTLARAKDPRGDAALTACVEALAGEDWGEAGVDQLVLFESRAGAYHRLVEAPLTGPSP
ncbi:RNA 2',3'-cyclic phosphodiesterase [Aggregicoccus sp. 17bor-14]|uniref:RNA 2',3'-cyclic phosphodiesterase n=1 Tax=Myxococcaceae TaxID=31 RepID=UPI00129C70E1|nr:MULTISPECIES: RNA 2',3'-cyclic phosphodiesterase [Myxococcaceae]MBF5041779.1 RNA 2',3'-cyclic phosphodiesterase [Simulacricoccus sp. 17bor-14]MRI87560.1 RNA 2',3'-cyclic phosphodiesterase [Aggregicoccus sp. 17bor-14]